MKRVLALVTVLAVLAFGVSLVNAQIPNVQVFFDEGYGYQTRNCTPPEVFQAYVVAKNFNMWFVGVEYAVAYPPMVTWLGDSDIPPTTLGSTPLLSGGISEVWSTPQNGFGPVRLATITLLCNACIPDTPLSVVPHPISGFIRATRYPDLAFQNAVGMTSVFCPVDVPAENSTWGGVKALYGE